MHSFQFEKREYGEESTLEEIKSIEELVYKLDEKIIVQIETPISSVFQEKICHDKILEIMKDTPKFYLVINLIDSNNPSSEVKRFIKERYTQLQDRVLHVAIATGKNTIINNLLKFTMPAILKKIPGTIFKSMDEAINYVRDISNK